MGTLHAGDIAARCGWSVRTARRYLEAWEAMQATNPRVPRVTRERTGGRGRPRYAVDPISLARWQTPALSL